jgi:hypothetical protein
MGDFYGYNPERFVMPDRYGIGAASQVASNTIMNVSGTLADKKAAAAKEAEKQEKIRLAAEAAKKDWGAMSTSYSGLGKSIKKKAQSLVDSGAMTQAEADQMIEMYTNLRPNSIHQKDPEKYLTMLGTTTANIYDTLNKKAEAFQGQERSRGFTGAVETSMTDRFGKPEVAGDKQAIPQRDGGSFTEETITSRPKLSGAVTKEQIAGSPEVIEQTKSTAGGMEDLNKVPQFATAPTEEDLTKQKIAEEKNDIQKKKLALAENKESNIDWYREQMVNLANARDDLARANSRTQLDRFDVAIISAINETEDEITKMKNKTDALGQPVEIDPIELAKKQKLLEEYKTIKTQTIGDSKLQTIRRDIKTGRRGGFGETPSSVPQPTQTRDRPSGNLPPLTVPTVMGNTTLPGFTQTGDVPSFNSEEEARAAGHKNGSVVRILGIGKVRLR